MSPEQVEGARDLDARADIWSLAATLYEALSGLPTHPEPRSLIEVFVSKLVDDPTPLSSVAPWVPQPLCDVVHAALARDRDARTPDAATFARALLDAIGEAAPASSCARPVIAVPGSRDAAGAR